MLVCILSYAVLSIQVDNPAIADDNNASQREQAIGSIRSGVQTIAKQLDGVAGADSVDRINIAIRQGSAIRQNVEALNRFKGSDSDAAAIVDRYPDYLDKFDTSVKALLTLKNGQLQQAERELWKRCAEEDKNLHEAVKPYINPPDPRGLDKIPDLAENAKDKIHNDYSRQLDQASGVARAYDDGKSFSVSDGDWSEVSSRMRDAFDSLWSKYQPLLKDINEKCTEIEKGKESLFIVQTLANLKSAQLGSKQLLDDILKDWTAWKQLRRDLAASYVANADKVRMAICDGDDENIQSRVEDAEKAAQGNLSGGYQTLDNQLDQLIERISKLDGDNSVGEDARKWRGVMRGAKTRLANVLKDGGVLHGVENAKVRARIDIGIKKHAQLQTGCTAHEYVIPNGRIDCLNVSDGHCEVIEIKPNNDKARAKGRTQLDGYKDTIESLHADDKLQELLKRCINNGELNITYDVEVYEFCPVPDDDIDAMLAEQAKQSSSTADE